MAKRPMLNLTTTALVERIASGDVAAAREGTIRLAHGCRPHNAARLRKVLGDTIVNEPAPVLVPVAAPVAVEQPAPVQAPAPAVPGVTPEIVAAVLAALAVAQGTAAPAVAESAVVSQPVPARSDVRAAAAKAFAQRVSALATEGNIRFLATRAKQVATEAAFSLEDVEGLTDQDCMDLVIATVAGIRPTDEG